MFKQLSIVALAASLATTVTANGNAKVVNNCPFEVTLWSVGTAISDPHTLAAQGGKYAEKYTLDPNTSGRTIKITKESDGLYTGKPQTDFAYSIKDGNRVFYDLSDVFGDAFSGHKLTVRPSDSGCRSLVWENGTPPGPSQTRDCDKERDVTLTLCA